MPVTDVDTANGTVSIEWIVGIVRYHGKEAGFGSPYRFSVVMTAHGAEAVFVGGQMEQGDVFTTSVHRAIRDAMHAVGIERVRYERIDADGTIRHKVVIR